MIDLKKMARSKYLGILSITWFYTHPISLKINDVKRIRFTCVGDDRICFVRVEPTSKAQVPIVSKWAQIMIIKTAEGK